MANEALAKLDLSDAVVTTPNALVQKAGEKLSGLQSAGVGLARWLIIVICVALVTLAILVASSELWPSSDVNELHRLVLQIHEKAALLPADSQALPEARKDLLELTRQIVEAKQSQRSFWMQFSQMILLNLLLPVLTAVLGYVFGSNLTAKGENK